MLQRYPEKANDYIEYTYSRADVAEKEASKWVIDARDCQWVNYEQLIISQKRIFCILLNMAFWKRAQTPTESCKMVMNALRWKQFVHAELLYFHKTRRYIEMLVEKGPKYTFCINNHLKRTGKRVRRAKKLIKGKKRNTTNFKQVPKTKKKRTL